MALRRIKITLAYDGGGFHGWQVQPGLATIQGTLEEIVGGMEGRPVHVAGSGRTDAGVHALEQVAAFSLENPIPLANLRRAVNRLLPPAIRVLSAEEVHADFHPRFDAKAKTYEYRIFRGETCSPFEWPYVYHYPYPLDEERMRQMALVFAGEHDFTAYAASDASDARSEERETARSEERGAARSDEKGAAKSDDKSDAGREAKNGADHQAEGKSKVRTVFASTLRRDGERLIYQVRGSGFLKHMVRNLVGTLIEAGRGNIADGTALPSRCGPTAPAKGLFLVSVEYD